MLLISIGELLVDEKYQEGQLVGALPGGSPPNVAKAFARLGGNAEVWTVVGPQGDAYSDLLRQDMAASKVTVRVLSDSLSTANVAIANVTTINAAGPVTGAPTKRHNTDYEFRIKWEFDSLPNINPNVSVVHTGSLATALEPGASLIVERIKELSSAGSVTLSYDPNIRPRLLGTPEETLPRVEEIVSNVHIVKASNEDLHWLYQLSEINDPDLSPQQKLDLEINRMTQIAQHWLTLGEPGPAVVVVTLAEHGAIAVTPSSVVHVPNPPGNTVVDTIGAGDTFMGTLLFSLERMGLLGGRNIEKLRQISSDQLTTAVRNGVEAAAINCSRPGCDPPYAHEVSFPTSAGTVTL